MTAAPRRDGALVASAAAVLYLLLLQDRFYGADGHVLLQMAVRGADVHERHLLYLPAARAALALLAPLGVTPFRALEVLSAVATALGVFVLHRTAARCGHPRAAAAVAAVGCAVLPVTLFFATTIEVHGLFFLPAALAWYAAARCAARPVAWTGCALGAACALAGCTHASGHAMLFLLVPVVALQRGVRAAVRPALAAGAVHAAFLAALSLARPRHGDAWRWLPDAAERLSFVAHVPEYFCFEYLLPTLPFGAVALAGAVWRPDRFAVAHAVVVVAYSWAVVGVLIGLREFGAYAVPLVWPAVHLAVRRCGARRSAWLAALAAAAAIGGQRWWDTRPERAVDVAAVARLAADGPTTLLVAGSDEADPVLRALPHVAVVILPVAYLAYPGTEAEVADRVAFALDLLLQNGQRVFMTETALAEFARTMPGAAAEVRARLRFTAVVLDGLRVERIERP